MQTNDKPRKPHPTTTRTTRPRSRQPKVIAAPAEEVGKPEELPTEYAVGSDGHLYVTEQGFKPGGTAGRKQFVGYQLTDEEAAEVWEGIHLQAFNATHALRSRR